METLTSAFNGIASGIGPFLILLGLLIFVHELGHFLVAKLCGVRVETFSLGFGRKILKFKRGDTTYCVSLIPLGGYVKMFGDDPSKEIAESEKRYSFLHKPVGQRIAIVLAGPLMNLVFAFFLFILIGLVGEPVPGNYVGDVNPSSRAYEAGFRSGDKVLKINGKAIQSWQQLRETVADSPNKKLDFTVEREFTNQVAEISATPLLGESDNILSKRLQVGVIEGLDSMSYAPLIGVRTPGALQSLDLVLAVNEHEVFTWRELEYYTQQAIEAGRTPINFKVQSYYEEKAPLRQEKLDFKATTLAKKDKAPTLADFGVETAQLYLWKVKRGAPADRAGLKPGDRVTAISGHPVTDWNQVIELVKKYTPEQPDPEFTFDREGKEFKVVIKPELTQLMDARGMDEKRYTVGIVSGYVQVGPRPVVFKTHGLGQTLATAVQRTQDTTGLIVMSLVRLVQGDVSARNIGGIISIGRVANQSYEAGLATFLRMMALISINLFLLNLLPVPVLDGGHLVFFSIEALRGTPLSMRKMEIAQQVGLVLLMSLMAFALFNDISNWLNSVW